MDSASTGSGTSMKALMWLEKLNRKLLLDFRELLWVLVKIIENFSDLLAQFRSILKIDGKIRLKIRKNYFCSAHS